MNGIVFEKVREFLRGGQIIDRHHFQRQLSVEERFENGTPDAPEPVYCHSIRHCVLLLKGIGQAGSLGHALPSVVGQPKK